MNQFLNDKCHSASKRFFRWCAAASLGIVVFHLLATAHAADSKPSDRPNIIFILADDMGIGDCGVYNPESKISTPNIDRLAREGMRFTDAHAAGAICVPSRYGLMTGEYVCRTWNRWPPRGCSLHDPKKVTLASLLKLAGYDTAMVGKWHLGIRHNMADGTVQFSPVEFGFDYFFGMNQSLDTQPYFYVDNDRMVAAPTEHTEGQEGDPAKVSHPNIQGPMWREGAIAPGFEHAKTLPLLTAKAVEYLNGRSVGGNPFFLYFAMTAPHAPWLPLPEFQGKSGAGGYGDFAMQVDDCVGQVLAALERRGLAKNTLVIFSSDNGPLWFPQDVERYAHKSSGIYRGMKLDYYEGGHREPFVARWPEKIMAGSISTQMVNFTDMMATFADIAGVKVPPGAGLDSFSMAHVLLNIPATGPVRKDCIHEHFGRYSLAYRQGAWKLLLPYETYQVANGSITASEITDLTRFELHNLEEDPGETINLTSEYPEKAKALFESLKDNLKRGASR